MWVGLWRLLGGSLLCGAGYVLCCSLIFSWESGAGAGTGSDFYDAGLIISGAVFFLAGWAVLNWSVRGWAFWVLGGVVVGALFWRFATTGSETHQPGPGLALGAIGAALLLAAFGFAIAAIPAVRQRLGAAGDAWQDAKKITLNTDFQFKGGRSASTNEHINGPYGITGLLIGCYLVAIIVINPGPMFGLFLGLTFPFAVWLVEGAAHRHVFESPRSRSWSDQWAAALKWWSALILGMIAMSAFAAVSPQGLDEIAAFFGPDLPGETDEETEDPNPQPLPEDARFTGSLASSSPGGAHGVVRLRGRPGKKALLTFSIRGLPSTPPPQRYVIWSLTDRRVGTPIASFTSGERNALAQRVVVAGSYLNTADVWRRIEITRTTYGAVVAESRRVTGDRPLESQGPVVMRGRWRLDD